MTPLEAFPGRVPTQSLFRRMKPGLFLHGIRYFLSKILKTWVENSDPSLEAGILLEHHIHLQLTSLDIKGYSIPQASDVVVEKDDSLEVGFTLGFGFRLSSKKDMSSTTPNFVEKPMLGWDLENSYSHRMSNVNPTPESLRRHPLRSRVSKRTPLSNRHLKQMAKTQFYVLSICIPQIFRIHL